jgi:hypothetical protein
LLFECCHPRDDLQVVLSLMFLFPFHAH